MTESYARNTWVRQSVGAPGTLQRLAYHWKHTSQAQRREESDHPVKELLDIARNGEIREHLGDFDTEASDAQYIVECNPVPRKNVNIVIRKE